MNDWIRIIGVFVIALLMFSVPVLWTLSLAFDWVGIVKFVLSCACVVEFILVASCIEDMGEEYE